MLIVAADCRELLAATSDASVDLIYTDPSYALGRPPPPPAAAGEARPKVKPPRVGREPGKGNFWRFPRAAVIEVLGIAPKSFHTTAARAGFRWTPDAEGLRNLVHLLAPRMGYVLPEEP